MTMRDFVRRAEKQSKNSINDCYISIDCLYYELDLLNDMLLRYLNRQTGHTLTYSERKNKISDIRDRIPFIYKDINYYKECINAEKMEIKRIHETYGYFDEPHDGEYYDVYEDELEDITQYKYNFVNETYDEVITPA
jgi:hypothetical protein